MIKKVYITDKQNIIDIALENYGNVDSVFQLLKHNNLDLLGSLEKGKEIEIPSPQLERDKKLLAYFQENKIKIATDVGIDYNDQAGFSYGFSIGFNA